MSATLYLSANDRLQVTCVAGGKGVGPLLEIHVGSEYERIGREGARRLVTALNRYLRDMNAEGE